MSTPTTPRVAGAPATVEVRPPDGLPRLPPGQVTASHWPVLHHGEVPAEARRRAPATDGDSPAQPAADPGAASSWTVRLFGTVGQVRTVTLAQLQAVSPATVITADVHCVTGWSLLSNRWDGVRFSALEDLAAPLPQARFLMAHAAGGWTTNLSLADCRREGVALVWARNGAALAPAHGGPLRLLVPHLYFWKSCKWLVGLEWMVDDRPGFWERDTKYKNLDPWHAVRDGRGETRATDPAE